MTTFSEKSNLSSAPVVLAPAAEVAWALVRELHGQARISAVEGRALLHGLWGDAPAILPRPADAVAPDRGSADAVAKAVRLVGLDAGLVDDLAGLSSRQVSGLLSGWCIASAETAVKIEAATSGRVSRARLRPDLWPEPGFAPAPRPEAAGGDA